MQKQQEQSSQTNKNYLSSLGANKKTITKIFNLNQLKNKYKNQNPQLKINQQSNNLFIGGNKVLTDQITNKYDIKAILTVLDYKTYQKLNLQQKISDLDLVQRHFFVDLSNDQHENIISYAQNSFDFIDESLSNMNVLVHCSDGLCRSPAIVIYYLMKKFDLSFNQVYQLIQKQKKEIKIKNNFLEQLKKGTNIQSQSTTLTIASQIQKSEQNNIKKQEKQ